MDSFIARQPIFTSDKILYGYELLYRSDASNAYPTGLDGDSASQKVIFNALFTFDLDSLTKELPAFINFTRPLLLAEVPLLLDPQRFTIEILEDVCLDMPLLQALQRYKDAGYTLVLDDYTNTHIPYEFLSILDIIKVDFRDTNRDTQKQIAARLRNHVTLLAEKIETANDFTAAVTFGYTLFQGYFFSKPAVLKQNMLSIASSTYAKLLSESTNPKLDFKKVADIIYPDAELTLLLMKKMRSSEYYRGHTVSSIHLALVRMGTSEMRRWTSLLLAQKVLGGEMDELIRVGLIRAVFCECLSASMCPELQPIAFTAGLFSVIAAVDDTFHKTLGALGMEEQLASALDGSNDLGKCLNLVRAYESGDWTLVPFLLHHYFTHLNSHDLSTMYTAAVNYADSTLGG